MKYGLENNYIKIELNDYGAEMQSIVKDGKEYLWVADEKYWNEHSPILFPFVGRLTEGKYQLKGKEYSQIIHGFARQFTYEVLENTEKSITFSLKDNEQTWEQYPYHFELQISYTLEENKITVGYLVKNLSEDTMYFGIGGHPGFNLPLDEGLVFEDYYLEFERKCQPERIGFTKACFLNGQNENFLLEDDQRLSLKHNLFDQDAIVLQHMADCVTLKSDKGNRKVTVSYPDMSYLGIWHNPFTEAPFVAIEPWGSLPFRQDVVEDIQYRSDYVKLKAGLEYCNQWTITIE